LNNLALIKAFHAETNAPVKGPFGRTWTMSQEKFFLLTFTAMAIYFWFPSYLFQALSYFNWMTWIAPANVTLAAVTGTVGGMGFNPWPTFDWNNAQVYVQPLTTPSFTVCNLAASSAVAGLVYVLCSCPFRC
jgi:hypothetical protein